MTLDAQPSTPEPDNSQPEPRTYRIALAEGVQVQWGEFGAYRPVGQDAQVMWSRRA